MTRVLYLRQACRPAARAVTSCAHPATPSRSSRPVFPPGAGAKLLEALEARVLLTVITVTSDADDGPGSLRQAIVSANASPGEDEIRFRIPGGAAGDVHTIRPLSPLPEVTGPTVMDGRPPSGPQQTHPVIELDGSAAGPLADGLSFTSASGPNTVRGLAINRFSRHGVVLGAAAGNTIQFCYVGTDAFGQADRGNGGSGVVVLGPATIGGTRDSATDPTGNVISGNAFAGIWANPGATGVLVSVNGNNIGTDATGSRAIGNGREGILAETGQLHMANLPAETPFNNLISGNGSSGVRLGGGVSGNTEIYGNYFGTDASGSRAIPNGSDPSSPYHDGITNEGRNGFKVGDTGRFRNLISGNVGAGIATFGGSATFIAGNYIGTDASGNADVGNGGDGIALFSGVTASSGTQQVQSNVISGNGGDGIHLECASSTPTAGPSFISNRIGTNAAGSGPLGNDGDGIEVSVGPGGSLGGAIGSPTASIGNVISANGGAGVVLNGPGVSGGAVRVSVLGNRIGTDLTGNVAMGNGGDGVRVSNVFNEMRVENNLVSANDGNGILVANSGGSIIGAWSVVGNFVGTNAAGTAPLGNGQNGVEIRLSTLITVGGGGSRFRNIISANAGHGILVTGPNSPEARANSGHVIRGNYIGTDATGSIPLGNGGSGVYLAAPGQNQIGGSTPETGNVISANRLDGITVVGPAGATNVSSLAQNRIQGNRIGTNAAGSDAINFLGNGGRGVAVVNSSNNMIGSSMVGAGAATEGNVIGFNGGAGVAIEGGAGSGGASGSADGNTVVRNSIFSNGGLGIDLVNGYEGVTPNDPRDADGGPDGLQNFPVVARATASGATVTSVRYSLSAVPSRSYRIDFYASPAPDPSGFGEGKTYLGSASVTTDSNGNASGSANLPTGAAVGSYVTATATTTGGSSANAGTSEFSPAARVVAADAPSTVEGRFVFYNGSTFDRSVTGATVDDDAAIATDKQALLPGAGPATFANYTNYTRGINGVMVDVLGLPLSTIPNAADFSFRVGRAAADGSVDWTDAPLPTSVTVRRGAGANGGDRVTLIWPNASSTSGVTSGAVRDGWLEVTVKGGARTGLAAPDVFYFGNLIGETGDSVPAGAPARVTAIDLAAVKRALGSPRDATNRFDLNKDGLVNAFDLSAVRANLYRSLPMTVATAAPGPAPSTGPTITQPLTLNTDATGNAGEGVWARLAT